VMQNPLGKTRRRNHALLRIVEHKLVELSDAGGAGLKLVADGLKPSLQFSGETTHFGPVPLAADGFAEVSVGGLKAATCGRNDRSLG